MTINSYAVDLGFNWHANPIYVDEKNSANNRYPLQYGILYKGASGQDNTPITPFQFADVSTNIQDTIYFWVNDITSLFGRKNSLNSTVSASVSLIFKNVDDGKKPTTDPLTPSSYTGVSAQYYGVSYSTVFQANVPRYAVGGSTPTVYTFTNTTTTLATNLKIEVTITLNSDKTKIFTLDPEMIIGATNNGNPDPDGSKQPPQPGR